MKNLVILAGGKSIRMGKDKVFLLISNETFVERLVCGGQKYFDRILISTDTSEHAAKIGRTLKENLGESAADIPILTDKYPDTGPIGALCTIFEETDLDRFAIIPVDVPNADMEFLRNLHDGQSTQPIVIAQKDNGKYEPLTGIYSREAYPILKEAMEREDFKVIRVIMGHFEAIRLDEAQQKAFRNINTENDYKELTE